MQLLGIYPEKIMTQKGTYTPIFIAAWLIIAKIWKPPKWPSTNKWINKILCLCVCVYIYIYTYIYMYVYIYIIECYSAIKRNEIESFVKMWMDLNSVIQNEVSQKKHIMYINTYMWSLEKWYRCSYLQTRSSDKDLENKCMDTKEKGMGEGNGRLGLTYIPYW